MLLADIPGQLITLDNVTGKPATTRIADGPSARALTRHVMIDDQLRSRERARVKGCIDGFAPYSEERRKANKLQWTANLNFMQGAAMMNHTAVPYYSIFNGVVDYAECCTNFQKDNENWAKWNRSISHRFSQMLGRWSEFDWEMQNASYWMRLHGIGPCFFDNDLDWRFRSLETEALLAPQGSPSTINKRIPYLVVRVSYRAHELYQRIRNPEAAKEAGWDVNMVKGAILASVNQHPNGLMWQNNPWEVLESRMQQNDFYTSFGADYIPCCHIFVQEMDGKISQFVITDAEVPDWHPDLKPGDAKLQNKGFLMRRPNQYESYAEVVHAFFLNSGGGKWHSVRGYGTMGFKYFELSNRLLCRAADGVFMKGSLILQPGTSKNADKLQLTQVGPVTYLPAGAQMQQIQMSGATDELMTYHRTITGQFTSNMGVNVGQPLSRTDGRGEVPTAEQIRAEQTQDATIGQGEMTLFYVQGDGLYAEMFHRASDPSMDDPEAKRFRDECKADGVPMEALRDMEYVRMNRASGYGSPQMRQMTDNQMMPYLPMLPEEGRLNFLEDAVAAIKGADKVDRYVPKLRAPDDQDWQAAVENDQVEDGREPILYSGQDDNIHLHSHLQDAANMLAPAQQAQEAGQTLDPEELKKLARYVEIMARHCEAHLARMQRDPTRKGLASMYQQQLAQLVSWNGKLRSIYIRSLKQQQLQAAQSQQATALTALDQARVQSVQTDNALNVAKAQNKISINNANAVNKMRLSTIQTASKIAQDTAKTKAQMKKPVTNGSRK